MKCETIKLINRLADDASALTLTVTDKSTSAKTDHKDFKIRVTVNELVIKQDKLVDGKFYFNKSTNTDAAIQFTATGGAGAPVALVWSSAMTTGTKPTFLTFKNDQVLMSYSAGIPEQTYSITTIAEDSKIFRKVIYWQIVVTNKDKPVISLEDKIEVPFKKSTINTFQTTSYKDKIKVAEGAKIAAIGWKKTDGTEIPATYMGADIVN